MDIDSISVPSTSNTIAFKNLASSNRPSAFGQQQSVGNLPAQGLLSANFRPSYEQEISRNANSLEWPDPV